MWMSRKMNSERGDDPGIAEIGKVTIGGEAVAVMTDHEIRNVSVLAPGGYYWRPRAGKNLLVLKCGDGSRVAVAGEQDTPRVKIKIGEVFIAAESGAGIHFRDDGSVNIIGTPLINGKPLVTDE